MSGGLIPNRYARALYKFALEHGGTKDLYLLMQEVSKSFSENPSFQNVLANPFVSREDKQKLLILAAGSSVTEDYKGFVKLILDNKREDYAYEMSLAFQDIYRKENNISRVLITTAVELPEVEIEKLHALIDKAFPARQLEYSHALDNSLIGGFVVDVDHVRMDASLSNEIEQLRLKLLSSK